MTISDMQQSITETYKTLSDAIEDLISTYDDESDCPYLYKALDSVNSMAESTDKGFESMNDALYLHLE